MRLPASVLGSLRLGVGATALLAGGCDAQEARTLEPLTASAPEHFENASSAPEVAASVVAVLERAAAKAPRPSTRAVREVAAATLPLAEARPEDVTAFVPFAEQPGDAAPIQPRPRPRIRTHARPRPQTRPHPRPRPVEVGSGWSPPARPKWDGGGCPACGRG